MPNHKEQTRLHLPSLFCFIFFLLFQKVSIGQDLKALEEKYEAAASDTARFLAAMEIHNGAFKSDPPKSKLYAERMLEIAKRFNANYFYYRAYNALGRCERKKRNYSSVFYYDSLWLAHSAGLSDPELFIIYSSLVNDYADNEQYDKSERYFPKALELARRINKPEELGRITYTRGMVLLNQFKAEASKPFFRQSIAYYLQSGNESKRRGSEVGLGESHLNLGENDSALTVLSSAYSYYAQSDSKAYRFAYLNGLLGSTYYRTGNVEKARKSFEDSRALFKEANNFPDYALVGTNLAALELDQGRWEEARVLLQESEKLSEENQFELGQMETFFGWAKYYSALKQYAKADLYFEKSARLMEGRASLFLRSEWKKAKAAHFYRQKKYKQANEMMFDYASEVATQRDKKAIVQELKNLKGKGNLLDSTSFQWLKILFTPGGVTQVKKLLKEKPLHEFIKVDSLLASEPLKDVNFIKDSNQAIVFSRQMQEMEARYKSKALQDSLQKVETKENQARQELKSNQYLIGFLGLSGLLLAGLFFTQLYYRKKTEKDREHIARLKIETHHRVKNNLNMIEIMISEAENLGNTEAIRSLKGRLNAIKKLHAILQNESKTGEVAMQTYFEEICKLNTELAPEKNVKVEVSAPIFLPQSQAEDLGLILSELVSNSLKHAFNSKEKAEITVELNKRNTSIHFQYQDNGPGISADSKSNLGQKIIKGNSYSLGGKPNFSNQDGLKFQLTFSI
jgi:two-component sensor histidine kinase